MVVCVAGIGEVAAVSIMFPSLRKLTLEKMPKLEEWSEPVIAHDPWLAVHYVVSLIIRRCDNLGVVPSNYISKP